MGPASPSRPSSSPLDLCPSLLTLCSPSPRPPCFYPGVCQWHCLGKKLRLDHLGFFFFFAGHHHQFTPTLCLAFQAPTIQPRLPSQPHHPALCPHSPLLGAVLHVHPDPCTLHSLIFLPETPPLPSSLVVTRESLLPHCLLWEAVPDCTQGELGTALSRHPLIYNKGQGERRYQY